MTRRPWLRGTLILLVAVLAVPALAWGKPQAEDEIGWAFAYDDGDRVAKIVDPAGQQTRFEYNLDEQTKRVMGQVRTAADGSRVALDFDDAGRVTRMTDGAGSVAYAYDDRGLLTRVLRDGGPPIDYSYDAQGRVTRRQVGDFFALEYGYDFLGRLAYMDTPAGRVDYDYKTGQGMLVRSLPNGRIKTLETYAPNGQLAEITHGFFADPKGNSYRPLARYSYKYLPGGRIGEIASLSPDGEETTTTYTYDTSGRLTRAEGSGGRRYAYSYDAYGNRLTARASDRPEQIATYDWAGRLTSLNGVPTSHDAAGNLTAVTTNGRAVSYRYNADNQLAAVDDGRVTYRYDGDGRLIARSVSGAESAFVPDPLSPNWQPLVMQEPGGHRTLMVWEGERPLLLIRDGQPQFLLHDHLGSVRLVADGKGRISKRIDYEPFGTPIGSAGAEELMPRFAGLFWDCHAHAYLTAARTYSADLGHFTGLDPKLVIP